MNREDAKQWLRSQIESCIKTQSKWDKTVFDLCYNKSYLRALKLSKITGKPVNKNNFKGGETLFGFDTSNKKLFFGYSIFKEHLNEKYSKDYIEQITLIKDEVLNEYEEYKDYNVW